MANGKPKEKKKLVQKLRNKYRLVILNDDTFEEKLSLKLSRLNVFFVVGISAVLLVAGTTLLIAFTPLKEYIPGYSSTSLRRKAFNLAMTTDSLRQQITYNQRYLLNIRNIIEGKPILNFSDTLVSDSVVKVELNKGVSKRDSQLRNFVEKAEQFDIATTQINSKSNTGFSFFVPVKGLITNGFDAENEHFGIDIVAQKNEVIKACLDGIVIFSEWTSETGHVLIIQHSKEFLSVYKHNSALLKKQGELVKAGEPVAIIGNSGELSTGPHVHFELWYNGNPVNPENFISF